MYRLIKQPNVYKLHTYDLFNVLSSYTGIDNEARKRI